MKKKIFFTVAMFMLATVVVFAQDADKKTKEKVNDTKKEMNKVDKNIEKEQKKNPVDNQQFKKDTKERLDKIDKNLADISDKVKSMDGNDKQRYAERVKELKNRSKELRKKLDSIESEKDFGKLESFQEEFQADMKKLDKDLDNFFKDNKKNK